jgi:hypothetical protein
VPRVLVLCGLRKGAVQAPLGRYLAAPRRQPEGTQFRGGYDVIPAVGDMRLQSQMVTRSTEETAVPRSYLCTWPSRTRVTRRRRSEGRRPARAASFPLPLAQACWATSLHRAARGTETRRRWPARRHSGVRRGTPPPLIARTLPCKHLLAVTMQPARAWHPERRRLSQALSPQDCIWIHPSRLWPCVRFAQ